MIAVWPDPLILAEDAVGKQEAVRAHLKTAVWGVVHIDVLATQIFGRGISFEDDPLSVVGQRELIATYRCSRWHKISVSLASEIERGRCLSSARRGVTAKCSL
jgi:hypothetical protein